MAKEFVGDSAQQVFTYNSVTIDHKSEGCRQYCDFCEVHSEGCINPTMHYTGSCENHLFLDEKLRLGSEDLVIENGIHMTEDTQPYRNIHESPTEPLKPIGTSENDLPTLDQDEEFEHTTMIMEETILLGKFLDIFNRETTQTFQQFMDKLKKAIEFAEEKKVDVRLSSLRDRVDVDRIHAKRSTIDNSVTIITMRDFIKLYEGLKREWNMQLSVFKQIRDADQAKIQSGDLTEHRLPDIALKKLINAFVTRHLGVPHQISLYHPEDHAKGSSQGVNTLRRWVQELILQEFDLLKDQ